MADADRGNWEDHVWRIKVKGKPEEINRFAAELTAVGGQFGDHSTSTGTIADSTKPKGEGGWHGPAGTAFRKYVDVTLTDPLADRHKAIKPVTQALEKAAEALTKAQKDMPMPVMGTQSSRAAGITDASAGADGHVGQDFDYQAAAYRIWNPGEPLYLGWYPAVGNPVVVEPTEDQGVVKTRILDWYEQGRARANEVESQLIADYTAIKDDLLIKPYKAEDGKKPGNDPKKDGDTGGGDPTSDTGGGPKTGTGDPKTDLPKTDPTKTDPTKPDAPKTDPDAKPDQDPNQNPDAKKDDPTGQNPAGDPDAKDPETPQDPDLPGPTDPDLPDPSDPYDPGSYEPTDPTTGLAGAGGGGGGGLGGGLGEGPAGPGTGKALAGAQPAGAGSGAGGGAGQRMTPMMGGMGGMGHGGGHGGGDGTHETWLTEDEDPWGGGEGAAAPPVVGM